MFLQPEHIVETPGAQEAIEKFNPGETIIEHVSNSPIDHPLIHFPTILGIDFSVTKHVLMVWVVAAIVFVVVTVTVRRYLRQDRHIPSGFMNALEFIVLYLRDNIVEPNVGKKWVNTYAPLLLTFFLFILTANLIGIIPIFDVLSLINHTVIHAPEESFFALVPHAPVWLYPLLIPLEIIGMLVRPFALTMRLAANMTGGHVAILAILSFVFIFFELFGQAAALGVGVILSLPVGVGLSGLELIVILVQAYVFTLLSAVFIGMAIHAHH
jgi:F-type H+-transporting ATPase subunit a